MRVLLITHRYPPDGIGGVERYVESLARELKNAGDCVAVLTRTPTHLPRRPMLRVDVGGSLRVHRILGSGVRLDDPLARIRRLDALLMRVIDRERPDLVHVNHLIGLSPRTISLVKERDIPVVLSLHDYYFACPLVHLQKRNGELCAGSNHGLECASTCFAGERRAEKRWTARDAYYRGVLRAADVVLCPPGSVAAFFAELEPSARLRALTLGVDVHREADEPAMGRLRVVMLGTVAPHKGARVVVDALVAAKLDAELVLAGPIDSKRYLDEIHDAAKSGGVELTALGTYTTSQLPSVLSGAHVAVFASVVHEVFPLAPRESLACGVPVIVSDVRGLAEVVEIGRNGLVVPAGDIGALAAALRRVADEPEFRASLRRGARETAVPTLTEHAIAVRRIYADTVREADSFVEPGLLNAMRASRSGAVLSRLGARGDR